MNIFLTFDYEIYFGNKHGSVSRCMIEPTNLLLKMAAEEGVVMTFFIDICFIEKLREYAPAHESAKQDLDAIENQIHELVAAGHDCQLHIHPHWVDCSFDGTKWLMDVSRYKLSDFSEASAHAIITEGALALEELTGKPVTSFRAGGWCLQPFAAVKYAFENTQVRIDSTVFPGGKNTRKPYFYDFEQCPLKTHWKFSQRLCEEDDAGEFTEYPIASQKVSPLFFWRLFAWGRLDPKNHKPLGDGFPVSGGGSKREILTRQTLHPVSTDGYFATLLRRALKSAERKKRGKDFVTIGHPKACTYYSVKRLKSFVHGQKRTHKFCTFADVAVSS